MTGAALLDAAVTQWGDLCRELDTWGDAGRTASFWLRDDDAVAPTPALERLLDIAVGLPLALAVIPARATPALAERTAIVPDCIVLQHGFAHRNHATPGARKSEYGRDRPLDVMAEELRLGWSRLSALFGAQAIPVLAPPWNRIADEVAATLPSIGITALSRFGLARAHRPGLRQINTHIDPIDWRDTRGHLGDSAVLAEVLRALRARRVEPTPATQPIGILTHHLVNDEAAWCFVARFVAETRSHPAARWCGGRELFAA